IAAAGATFQIRSVLFSTPVEVEPVVSRVVEKVALQPPCLVVHLLPLRTRVHVDLESVKLQGALRLLRRRRRARAGLRHWRDGRDEPLLALPEQRSKLCFSLPQTSLKSRAMLVWSSVRT